MTTGKRALIVDDSRSARVILSRMLEQHGMAVDTAESAEQALEYLHQQRPDVIFMDHLMPGMDGFQAVQAIKADAQTATIPLMMYTSQEGELYVSQARALGAVGVLPKTVRPVDVSRVLYQLHLLPDRRTERSALFDERAARAAAAAAAAGGRAAVAPADGPPPAEGGEPVDLTATGTGTWAVPTAALSEMQGRMQQSVNQLVRDQLAEQRRFMLATFEAFARRMSSEIKDGITKATPPPAEPVVPPPPPTPWWPMVLTGLLAVVPAAILGFLYWQSQQAQAGLARDLADAKAQAASAEATARAALTPLPAGGPAGLNSLGAPRSGPPGGGPLAVEYVPYGETPLANARLERLRMVATTLEGQQFRGRIVIESFIGDFRLSGNATDGFTVAETTLPTQKCDLVGNPYEDAMSPAQRQSV
ncbi:MAG TPA: response regulator, partial [Quisquiliibacterium sp.]|nr:response regulator [Quisquiliibacterium sp.]